MHIILKENAFINLPLGAPGAPGRKSVILLAKVNFIRIWFSIDYCLVAGVRLDQDKISRMQEPSHLLPVAEETREAPAGEFLDSP